MANFNTTQIGVPYKRVNRIVIEYAAPFTARVTFTEQEFVPLVDGSHRSVGNENERSFEVNPENMADTLPVTDVETGAPLGIETDYGHVMLGIVAAIRAHQ